MINLQDPGPAFRFIGQLSGFFFREIVVGHILHWRLSTPRSVFRQVLEWKIRNRRVPATARPWRDAVELRRKRHPHGQFLDGIADVRANFFEAVVGIAQTVALTARPLLDLPQAHCDAVSGGLAKGKSKGL